jgi:hypothetical protein
MKAWVNCVGYSFALNEITSHKVSSIKHKLFYDNNLIEEHILDINPGKQQSQAATDV